MTPHYDNLMEGATEAGLASRQLRQVEAKVEEIKRRVQLMEKKRPVFDVYHEGVPLREIREINLTGAGVEAVRLGHRATVEIPGANLIGSGGLVHYDYIVDSAYSGTDGATVTLGTGGTVRIFTTVQAAIDAADAQTGDITIWVNEGANEGLYNENITFPSGLASSDNIALVGEAHIKIIIGTTGATADACTFASASPTYYIKNIEFRGGSSGHSVTSSASGISAHFEDCDFNRSVSADFAGASFRRCVFDGGYDVDSGDTPTTVLFTDCEFTGASAWADSITLHIFVNCRWGSSTAVITSTSTLDSVHFLGCQAVTSGSAAAWFTKNGGGMEDLAFVGCWFTTPGANGVIYFQVVDTSAGGVIVSGNYFNLATGSANPFIKSDDASVIGVCVVGNTFGADGVLDYVEDNGGVSITGSFSNSVFGPNVPPDFDINVAAGTNNLYIGTGTVTGAGSVTVATDHGALTGLTDDDHTQYLKEEASGGLASEVPDHTHASAAEAGSTLSPTLLNMTLGADLTIATGAITVTHSRHRADTEAAAASDDLDTINGSAAGRVLILQAVNDARSIVIKHGTGNIQCVGNADLTLDDDHDFAVLVFDTALNAWMAMLAGAGGAGGTHTMLDATTHTDTAADSVSRGSLIYGNATPAWDELVVGSANSVLWTDGTDASWSTAPRLANIADTGGTNRITLATTAPFVTITGTGAINLTANSQVGLTIDSTTFTTTTGIKMTDTAQATGTWTGILFEIESTAAPTTVTALNITPQSGATAATVRGLFFSGSWVARATVINFTGVSADVQMQPLSGTTSSLLGLAFSATVQGNSLAGATTVTDVVGCRAMANYTKSTNANNMTITFMADFHSDTLTAKFSGSASGGTGTITTYAAFYFDGLNSIAVGTNVTVTTAYGLYLGGLAPTSGTITNRYGIYLGAIAGGSLAYLLELGTGPTLRLLEHGTGGWTAAANETPLWVKEGATPTLRQMKTMDPGAGGANFVGGELVCYLV